MGVEVAEEALKKRRVRSPETFREKVQKTQTVSKPSRLKSIFGTVWRGVKAILKPVFKPFVWLAKKPPLKWLAKPMRLLSKILLINYIRNSWRELRLVTWPSFKQSRQLTFAVLAFAVVFGGSIALVDYGLDKVFKHILLK